MQFRRTLDNIVSNFAFFFFCKFETFKEVYPTVTTITVVQRELCTTEVREEVALPIGEDLLIITLQIYPTYSKDIWATWKLWRVIKCPGGSRPKM